MLIPLAENLWEVSRPLKAPGLRIDHRMSVVRLSTGELLVHSPVELDGQLDGALASLGPVRHLVAPSTFHDLYWLAWFARYPQATFWGVPGLREAHPELPFHQLLNPDQPTPWEAELPKLLIAGMPKLNEYVFFHSATRSLIVADLVFNFSTDQNLLGKLFLKANACYGKVACSRLFRAFIKDRNAFRQSVEKLMEWDFERIVVGHGKIVPTGGKEVLAEVLLASRRVDNR
ncbi:MAG: DUF4336 domain-containing protein [Candidatus Latescibacteria bacterium]|nr:DUF4336 domain-containing protein [Candidatus Latescibacterota bacterium]